jgi:proline iminopeptidase
MDPYLRMLICSLSVVPLIAGCTKHEDKSVGVVAVEGAELHYVIEGTGTPCLVLGHSESARRILSQELRNHFKFVFVDLRHEARSNSSLEISKITLDTYLDDIDKVRRTLGLDKTAVLGHSHHGLIALEYARKHPHNTTHVIMSGCTPYTAWGAGDEFWESDASEERKMIFKQNWERLPQNVLAQLSPKERQVKTYVAMTPKLLYDPKGDLSYIVDAFDNNKDVFLHYQLVILKDYDIAKRPGRVETPVFLAIGRYDYVSPYYLWDDRKDVLPNLSCNLFEKSGHFPMVEEQELFDKKLIQWISSH